MNAFQDLAQMTRDYGLNRYFILTTCVVVALTLALWVWGHAGPPDGETAPLPAVPTTAETR